MIRRAGLVFAFVACLSASACGATTSRDVAVGARLVLPRHDAAVAATPTTLSAAIEPLFSESVTAKPQRVRAATTRAVSLVEPTRTGRIQIPAIGLDHATYEGIEPEQIDWGPSHWPGTAAPGDAGNAVFPGHRVTHSHPFLNIDKLQSGDQVIFENERGRFTYEVRDSFVVDNEDFWIAEGTIEPTFTLFSCHPKGSERQRFVVKGVLVNSERFDQSPSTTTTTVAPAQPRTLPRIGK